MGREAGYQENSEKRIPMLNDAYNACNLFCTVHKSWKVQNLNVTIYQNLAHYPPGLVKINGGNRGMYVILPLRKQRICVTYSCN